MKESIYPRWPMILSSQPGSHIGCFHCEAPRIRRNPLGVHFTRKVVELPHENRGPGFSIGEQLRGVTSQL